jgi:hypothetical protein
MKRKAHRILYATITADEGDSLRVQFTCKECRRKHSRWYGKRGRNTRDRVNPAMLRKFCKPGGYWTEGIGHCYGPCPHCTKNQALLRAVPALHWR